MPDGNKIFHTYGAKSLEADIAKVADKTCIHVELVGPRNKKLNLVFRKY
jgi:hypothetical protein